MTAHDMMPQGADTIASNDIVEETHFKSCICRMRIQCSLRIRISIVTDHMSFSTFCDLVSIDNDTKRLDFLAEL